MRRTQYRDREGALQFNVTINEEEITAICSVINQYLLDNSGNQNPIIQRRIETATEIKKTLEQ